MSRIKRIHVNQHVIRKNRGGEYLPPLTIKIGRQNIKAHQVEIYGPSTVVYRPDQPLDCGARVWIETRAMLCVEHAGERDFVAA